MKGMGTIKQQIVCPKYFDKRFLFILGLNLMIANKIRHFFKGYFSPRPFAPSNIQRSVNYCFKVVQSWNNILKEYMKQPYPFLNKDVLEIGPGPDLGTGLIILSLGAKTFTALDKHYLLSQTPNEFYKLLLSKLKGFPFYERAETACHSLLEGESIEEFKYIYLPEFPRDFPKLGRKFHILLSQAVFEHFSKTELVLFFKKVKKTLCLKAKMTHEIDLSTHTRFLRNIDPLNILRYPDFIWNLLGFDGSPNRLRISDYRSVLKRLGYSNIDCHSLRRLDLGYVEKMKASLYKRFRKYSAEDLSILSFYLLADND